MLPKVSLSHLLALPVKLATIVEDSSNSMLKIFSQPEALVTVTVWVPAASCSLRLVVTPLDQAKVKEPCSLNTSAIPLLVPAQLGCCRVSTVAANSSAGGAV